MFVEDAFGEFFKDGYLNGIPFYRQRDTEGKKNYYISYKEKKGWYLNIVL